MFVIVKALLVVQSEHLVLDTESQDKTKVITSADLVSEDEVVSL